MKYSDLVFQVEDYDINDCKKPPVIRSDSALGVWPSFPESILEGESEESIITEAIDALREVLGENCLETEYDGTAVIVHCGGIEQEIQEKWYDFKLVPEEIV